MNESQRQLSISEDKKINTDTNTRSNSKEQLEYFEKNILDSSVKTDAAILQEEPSEEERLEKLKEDFKKKREAQLQKQIADLQQQDLQQQAIPQKQPQELSEEQPEELSEETQTLACRSFYNDLRSQSDIIEKKDLNFDCIEVSLISDLVDQRLNEREINVDTSSDDFINFINKTYFNSEDFQNPIFQNIFNILALEIGNISLFLNNEHILEYGKIIKSGIMMTDGDGRSNNNAWLKETFIPELLNKYTTIYQGLFDTQQFNTIFIKILIALFVDVDFAKIQEKIADYGILQMTLTSGNFFIPEVKEYVDKNSEKLSILFNIPEDKVKENIMNFGTVNINFNSENIIITKTSTLILTSLQKNILGIALFKSTFDLIKNEKKATMICRWYIPINDKIEYKKILTESLKDPITHPETKKSIQKLLNILGCFQQKKLSEIHKEKKTEKTENICDNTLNTFFDDLKTNRSVQTHFLNYEGNTIKIMKYPKFNFDIVLKQKIHEYFKNEFFKLTDGEQQDFDDYLLSISEKCIEPNFAREIYNNGMQKAANGGKNSKIFNIIKTISKELVVNTEITINGEIVFDSYTTKNENGEKIGRLNSIDYFLDILSPYLLEKYKQNYNNSDCNKFNEGLVTMLFLLSTLEISSFILTSFVGNVYPVMTEYAPRVKYSPIVYEVIGFPDGRPGTLSDYNGVKVYIEKNKNKISKSFGISIETLNNILPHNKLKINITEDNIIINRTMVYGVLIQNILPNAEYEYNLLGLMITSEDFNFKNNTHDIICKMRWFPDNLLIKEVITSLNNKILSANEQDTQDMNKIINIYKCIYLNTLSVQEIENINRKIKISGAKNMDSIDLSDTNLTKTEKIKQKLDQTKERYREIEEEHPKKVMAAKFVGETVGTFGVVAGVSAAVLAGMGLLSAVTGGKRSKKNMKVNKRNKNKRITRNYKKLKKTKKTKNTRKRVKRVKKIRNTKKQRKTKI